MVPFEFLYGKLCQIPLSWDQIEDGVLVGLEEIQELKDQLQMIRKGMEYVQDQHKGLSVRITSTIIMKGLTASCASLFEALHDVYLVSMCEFSSMILRMRLTEFLADVGQGVLTAEPIHFLDRRIQQLRRRTFDQVNVQ
jgi:prefoldin subunit 5